MRHVKHLAMIMIPLLVAAGMAACDNVIQHMAHDDGDARGLAWPSPDQVMLLYKGGAYPGLSSLRQIHAGMNKHQIASLIGYPHFHEDAWDTREWNFVFRLPTIDGGNELCQYKIVFGDDKLARDIYWKSASCADLLKAKPAVASLAHPASGARVIR